MTFRVGQKVVCVDASLPILARVLRWIFRMGWPLVEGDVYTIEWLGRLSNEDGVVLVEVKNTKLLGGAFRRRRFRPMVERKADMLGLALLAFLGCTQI